MRITATFSAEGDTKIKFSPEYAEAPKICKLDFIGDILSELTSAYNDLLGEGDLANG